MLYRFAVSIAVHLNLHVPGVYHNKNVSIKKSTKTAIS